MSLRICSRDIVVTSFPFVAWGFLPMYHRQDADCDGKSGEDRNRTYPGPAVAGSTTVLKTARATRHPSLSWKEKAEKLKS